MQRYLNSGSKSATCSDTVVQNLSAGVGDPERIKKKKVEAEQTPEELLAIAKEACWELMLEQLEAVFGVERRPCKAHNAW